MLLLSVPMMLLLVLGLSRLLLQETIKVLALLRPEGQRSIFHFPLCKEREICHKERCHKVNRQNMENKYMYINYNIH